MEHRHTYHRSERLKSKKVIAELFETGRSTSVYPVRAQYRIRVSEEPSCQVTAVVSKRHFKNAVDRNRIKRQLREAYRLQKHVLLDYASAHHLDIHIVWIYLSKKHDSWDRIQAAVSQIMEHIIDRYSSSKK